MYWLTGILGLAFAVAPFFFGYNTNQAALWTSLFLGAAVMIISYLEGLAKDREGWEYWMAAIIGLGIVAAPFILNFGTITEAVWTSITVGLLLAAVAGFKLYYERTSLR